MEMLNGIMDRYIATDGGAFEGIGYQLHTSAFAMLAAIAYARYRNRPIGEIVSPKLESSVDFILTVLSEGNHPGSAIPIADGGQTGLPISAHCVALLRRIYDRSDLDPLLGTLLPTVNEDESMRIDNPVLLIFGPDDITEGVTHTPRFHILADSGLLTSSRPAGDGRVRVLLTGCQDQDAGHSHHDRGSIILEAFGKTLLCENGMIRYEIAEHVLLGGPRYHCIACPGPLDDLPLQVVPTPGKIVPEGSGDDTRLSASVDLARAWGARVRSAERRIESKEPTEFLLTDSFDLPESRPVTMLYNTTGTITADTTPEATSRFVVEVDGVAAVIEPRFTPSRYRIEENLYNAAGEACRLLLVEAPAATHHRLETAISIVEQASVPGQANSRHRFR
jgi:hypothetical protein